MLQSLRQTILGTLVVITGLLVVRILEWEYTHKPQGRLSHTQYISTTFLGFSLAPAATRYGTPQYRGVIWGKETRYYSSVYAKSIVQAASSVCALVAISRHRAYEQHPNITFVGVQSAENFAALLQSSKFLLGLGHPLEGPSGLEAMRAGAMLIIPRFSSSPYTTGADSQHPYMVKNIGEPYVCTFRVGDSGNVNTTELEACIRKALATRLEPRTPHDFERSVYDTRVAQIFGMYLNSTLLTLDDATFGRLPLSQMTALYHPATHGRAARTHTCDEDFGQGLIARWRATRRDWCVPREKTQRSRITCYFLYQTDHGGIGDNLCTLHDVAVDMGVFADTNVTRPAIQRYHDSKHHDDAYVHYTAGFVQADCTLDAAHYAPDKFPGWNADWLVSGLATTPLDACTATERLTTLVVQRDGFANLYHSSEDFINAYLALAILELSLVDVQIVLADLYPWGPFAAMWQEALGFVHPALSAWDLRAKYGTGRVCFDNLVVGIYGPASPFCIIKYDTHCEGSPLLRSYAHFVIRGLRLHDHVIAAAEAQRSRALRVTWMARGSPVPWPERVFCDDRYFPCALFAYGDRHLGRVVRNNAEVVDGLHALARNTTVAGRALVFTETDYNTLPFRKQLAHTIATDILVGPHGAGLTHQMFLGDDASVIELFIDGSSSNRHFHNMARWRGRTGAMYQGVVMPNPVPVPRVQALVVEAARRTGPGVAAGRYTHQAAVLAHVRERHAWETRGRECTPWVDRPAPHPDSTCAEALASIAPDPGWCPVPCPRDLDTVRAQCPRVAFAASMESDGTCVAGNAQRVCMSVDSRADVHMQYFEYADLPRGAVVPAPPARHAGCFASFVSNCVAWRTSILQDISGALEARNCTVHHYGRCLRNTLPGPVGNYAEKNALAAQHRYTFAFENSETPGYVTEKLLYILGVPTTVAVYRGAPDVYKSLPAEDAAWVFPPSASAEDIARALDAESDAAYAQRHRWRSASWEYKFLANNDYSVWHSTCRACVRIQSVQQAPSPASGLWVREMGSVAFHAIPATCMDEADYARWLMCIAAVLERVLSEHERGTRPHGVGAVVLLYRAWDREKCPLLSRDAVEGLAPGTELEVVLENQAWTRR